MNEQAYFVPDGENGPYFIPDYWKDDGTYSDATWPASAVLLSIEDSDLYWRQVPPEGKQLGAVEGKPAWVDVPALTQAQNVTLAEQKRSDLRNTADASISWLQDAVDLGEATDAETALLTSWKKYRIQLMRLDLSTAPDITWPSVPA